MGDIMYYINTFFINSIIGFLFETIWCTILGWNSNSGILYGPWTPVYGIGCIIIIIIYDWLNKKLENKFSKFVIFAIITPILLSSIEMIGGYIIEAIFNQTFWDYSDHKFNIDKYASLEMTLIWLIAAFFYIFVLRKIIDKFIYYISKQLTYILIFLFITDLFITLILKLNL